MTGRTPDGDARGHLQSLATFLHVGANEVFGVLFEHIVDLVEQVVGVLRQLLAPFLTGGVYAVDTFVIVAAPGAFGLLLCHRSRPPLFPPTGARSHRTNREQPRDRKSTRLN